ncbi:MAG: SMC-Scp complex subunit ScpB [Solirubrobacterales bacterium]
MDRVEHEALSPAARALAALLFCSPDPVGEADLAEAISCSPDELSAAVTEIESHYAEGRQGIVLRRVADGYTFASDPEAELAVRRLLAKPRTPPLTQAQAECLAITAYLQPVSRPEIARIRGVNSDSAMSTLEERGLIEERGRSQFGAIMYRTTQLFEKLFGLTSLDDLPDVKSFEPTAADEQQLREKLLRAGEQRVG